MQRPCRQGLRIRRTAGRDGQDQSGRIKSSGAQTIEPADVYSGLAVGDVVTIGSWLEFDTQKLINAINSVLRVYKVTAWNFDLQYDPDEEYYELPDEVTIDIRAVKLKNKATGKLQYSHYWRVHPSERILKIYDKYRYRYDESEGSIGILYVKPHGAVGKDDEISEQVDPLYLRYMAWLYLCRNLLQATHKDNLISSDMYNEAKIYERDYSKTPNKNLPLKSPTWQQW